MLNLDEGTLAYALIQMEAYVLQAYATEMERLTGITYAEKSVEDYINAIQRDIRLGPSVLASADAMLRRYS